jgi:hypothetical protein
MDIRIIKVRMPKLIATFSIVGPNAGNTINRSTNNTNIKNTLSRLFK